VRLFDRTPRAVTRTDEGRRFHAQVMRDTLGELIAEGFDAAVRFGEPGLSGLMARKLLKTRILTCAAPGCLARLGAPEHPRDLERHECLLFRDLATVRLGVPSRWRGRFDQGTRATGGERPGDQAGVVHGGNGIAQTIELGLALMLASGALVQVLPDWIEEWFPLYAYYPSRNLPPEKVGRS
jgi:DNA-binding transcriptional LysR family regulator